MEAWAIIVGRLSAPFGAAFAVDFRKSRLRQTRSHHRGTKQERTNGPN